MQSSQLFGNGDSCVTKECYMRIKYLKVFVDLAESGSFSEAAGRHGISQPAVSQQIGCLEEEFATPLVERSRRRFRLTPAGEALFVTAKEVLQSIDSVRTQIATLGHSLNGTLHVVTTAHLGVEVVPSLKTALIQAHPGLSLETHYQTASRIYADVAGNVADFGLLCCPKPDDRFETVILAEESFTFVTTPQTGPKFASGNPGQRMFIGYNPDPSTAQMISQTLREAGHPIAPTMEFAHPETVIKAVQATCGFACLPLSTVQSALAQGKLARMSTSLPEVTRQLGAIFYKQRINHPPLKAVRECLEQHAGQLPVTKFISDPPASESELSAA